MKAFFSLLSAEILKSKRTASFWVSLIFAALFPVISTIVCLFKPEVFESGIKLANWKYLIGLAFQSQSGLFMPMCAVLACTMMTNLEVKNNAWKQTFAIPRNYSTIFFSKFIVINLMILFYLVAMPLFGFLLGSLLPMVNDKFIALSKNSVDWTWLFGRIFHSYFFLLPIICFQFWLALRFRNVLLGIGVGLVLIVTGIIISSWDKVYLYPYVFALLDNNSSLGKSVNYFVLSTWLYSGGFFFLTWLDFVKRKER